MNTKIKLSVIVPVYNVEDYIRRALDSLVGQTYTNLEIILVDDGSTDQSGAICDEYGKKDDRIKVIHKQNGGIVSARKAGINMATGEYAINLDPDDWIEADAYENAIKIIEKYHPDMVAFGMKKEFANLVEEQPVRMKKGFYSKEEFWKSFCKSVSNELFFSQPIAMTQCDKVVKTELFKKHEFEVDEHLKKNVDDAVIFPMLLDMESIYIDTSCRYHYCVRNSSILWQKNKEDDTRYFLLAHHLIKAYRDYGAESGCTTQFLLYKLVHHMMLDIPEALFDSNCCKIFPNMEKDSRIIVYGKGVFANRLLAKIKENSFYRVINNIDSGDMEKIHGIDDDAYDYITVAIFNAKTVEAVLALLQSQHIDRKKIQIIEKKDITVDLLPREIREEFSAVGNKLT